MDLKRKSRREGGFTLIELISVIVILGILAAVVVPKYNDMTSQAQKGATMSAVTEGISRFNLAYANYTLEKSTPPTKLSDLNVVSAATGVKYLAAGEIVTGDYTFTVTDAGASTTGGGNGLITITAWLSTDGKKDASLLAQKKTIPVEWKVVAP